MASLRSRLERIAPYFRTVLLSGEPGSGQEDVARALHELSPMRSRPFAVFNAAEAESQLLPGHGQRLAAACGTLYLAEPARLSRPAQETLLHLLQQRSCPPPHVVTFAPQGIRPLIAQGEFSSELALILGSLEIEVPSLSRRSEDLRTLIDHLLRAEAVRLSLEPPEQAADFVPTAQRLPWPGNLDQLRAVLIWLLPRGGNLLSGEDLYTARAALAQAASSGPPGSQPGPRLVRLDQVIHEQVQAVLLACNGNKLRAAGILGISRSTLYRMLEGSCGWDAAAAQAGRTSPADRQPRRRRQTARAAGGANRRHASREGGGPSSI